MDLLKLALSKHISMDRSVLVSFIIPQMMTMIKSTIFEDRDSGLAYNIMRLYAQVKNTPINMVCKGLSNPSKISICVTSSNALK